MAAKVTWAREMFALVEQLPGVDVREYEYKDGTRDRVVILPKGSWLKTLNGRVLWGALARRTDERARRTDYLLKSPIRRIYSNDHSYRTVEGARVLSLWWEGELPD
jgi:hypothetical protein